MEGTTDAKICTALLVMCEIFAEQSDGSTNLESHRPIDDATLQRSGINQEDGLFVFVQAIYFILRQFVYRRAEDEGFKTCGSTDSITAQQQPSLEDTLVSLTPDELSCLSNTDACTR